MGTETLKSQVYVTEPVRAVFPHLNEMDRFGSYSLDIDVLDGANASVRETIEAQCAEILAAGQAKFGVTTAPTNSIIRHGEYKDQPFSRLSFKMKGVKNVKGREVLVNPTLVDSAKNTIDDLIYGGSLVKVAYFCQFTLMNGTVYVSVKLRGVQVLELVGPGGEVPCTDAFGVEDGFTTSSDDEVEVHVPTETTQVPVSTGADF